MYDPLASRRGRLTTFFLLYVTEGIPLGFTATAMATYMRREGVGPAQIGAFVGTLYLPWAWKWMVGPVVDLVYSDRLGRRRAWIVGAQLMMALMLVALMPVDFSRNVGLVTALVLVLNVFGATQDVAIDALAVGVLGEHERGTANGLMFAGAYIGQALGGSGVLYLTKIVPFSMAYLVVAMQILMITVFVALPMRERRTEEKRLPPGQRLGAIGRQIRAYFITALRAMLGHGGARAALVFGLLPCGAMALSLPLQTNLAVEIQFDDDQIATMQLLSVLLSAGGCVIGGLLSDRLGRRRMLAIYVAVMSLPAFGLAYVLYRNGWIMPVDPTGDPVSVPAAVIPAFWAAVLFYSAFQGLMYGTRTALFMDVCDPAVAATQFTAYMSLLNLVIWYSATWQGWALEHWGYPVTLVVDGSVGLLCLAALAFVRRRRRP
ncbi:MAG: MFS transporter [Planctomycetota bacterium]